MWSRDPIGDSSLFRILIFIRLSEIFVDVNRLAQLCASFVWLDRFSSRVYALRISPRQLVGSHPQWHRLVKLSNYDIIWFRNACVLRSSGINNRFHMTDDRAVAGFHRVHLTQSTRSTLEHGTLLHLERCKSLVCQNQRERRQFIQQRSNAAISNSGVLVVPECRALSMNWLDRAATWLTRHSWSRLAVVHDNHQEKESSATLSGPSENLVTYIPDGNRLWID